MSALIKSRIVWFSLSIILSLATAHFAFATRVESNSFIHPEHVRATEIITGFLDRYHYRKVHLDNDFSAQIFDHFIDSLDPSKSYFLARDINELSYYRLGIDDSLKNAKLDVAFTIFGLYQRRIEERTQYALSLLDNDFDFNIDESFLIDREDTAWPATVEEQNEIWRKRVKNDVLSLRLAGKDPADIKETLTKRYENALKRSQQFDSNDIYQSFINAYTTSIDPHTNYLSPRTYDNFEIRMSLSLEGIGALLRTDGDSTVVEKIIPGGPADLSGLLHAKDRIVGIAQEEDAEFTDVIGWRLEEVVQLIRGPKGTRVRMQIIPGNQGEAAVIENIVLKRNKIKLEEQAAKSDVMTVDTGATKQKVGIITIPTFYMDFAGYQSGDVNYRSTTRDVKALLDSLKKENIDSLIIDLRSNGGGSLIEATQLAGLFISKGPIVQVRDSSGHIDIQRDDDAGVAYQGPMIVLVDRYSASASEIVASALQDYRRAVVVGEPTYGKGSVQQLIDLDRINNKSDAKKLGQLKVTIAQYFRITGDGTQHRGVIPDIVYETYIADENQGERSLENALPWSSITPVRHSTGRLNEQIIDSLQMMHSKRIANDPSYLALIKLYQLNSELQAEKQISLVEKKRKQRFDDIEKQRENYEKLAGMYHPRTAQLKDTSAESPAAEQDDEETGEDVSDVLLDETIQMAADLSLLWDSPVVAEHQ